MESAGGLQQVEPGYRNVLRARLIIGWLVPLFASMIVSFTLLQDEPLGFLLPLAIAVAAVAVVIVAPQRIYRRLHYRLDPRLLQVVRGWLFHTDTVVPLVRVQHLDVVRGPFDKIFGTASLVVHTAGTLNSIVTLPGLSPERAIEIRDVIREQIRSDLA